MRFMIIVKATPDSEAGRFPPDSDKMFAAMADYHQALVAGAAPAVVIWQRSCTRVSSGSAQRYPSPGASAMSDDKSQRGPQDAAHRPHVTARGAVREPAQHLAGHPGDQHRARPPLA